MNGLGSAPRPPYGEQRPRLVGKQRRDLWYAYWERVESWWAGERADLRRRDYWPYFQGLDKKMNAGYTAPND